MPSISPITLDTRIKNGVHSWWKAGYDWRGETDRPAWLTADSSGKKLKGLFPSAPANIAAAIDSRAFGSVRSRGCYEGNWKRYSLLHALPEIIEGLEDAGLGNHAYTEELRKALYYADMWVADHPEITWTGASGGYYKLSVNGFVLDLVQP